MPSPEVVAGLVSVIIPVHDRAGMLREALACVEAQTYRQFEAILVDDGSTDGTSAICDELSRNDPTRVKVVHRSNGGPGAARESGRLVARGEFLQYLDSDDWIDPMKLEVQVAALRKDPNADIAYCRTLEAHTARPGVTSVRGRTDEHLPSIFPYLLSRRIWHTISPLYRRSFSDRLGPWTELRQEEDLEYDARAGALGARLVYCPEALAVQNHHEGERAGGGSERDVSRMRCRYESHRLVLAHARAAGVATADPNMQSYSRELFHLARRCGALGLARESSDLFRLAREAAGSDRAKGLDFRVYRALALGLGWKMAGLIATRMETVRRAEDS